MEDSKSDKICKFMIFMTIACGFIWGIIFVFAIPSESISIIRDCHPMFNSIDCYHGEEHCLCENRCNDLPSIFVPCLTPRDEVNYFIDHHFNDTNTWIIFHGPVCDDENIKCTTIVKTIDAGHTTGYMTAMIVGIVVTCAMAFILILGCVAIISPESDQDTSHQVRNKQSDLDEQKNYDVRCDNPQSDV